MDILEILKANGVEVPEDKAEAVKTAVDENYKANSEYEKVAGELGKAKETITANDEAIKDLEGKLAGFKDADVTGLKERIAALETEKGNIEKNYRQQLEDRDFDDIVKDAIAAAGGRNAKAIRALLDVDELKKSKNQKNDVAAAIKTLTEEEDSKMLFGTPEPQPTGSRRDIGGQVHMSGAGQQADTLAGAIAEYYKN